MMAPVIVLQHIACETLGVIEGLLVSNNIPFRYVRSYASEPIPKTIAQAPALIIMGGPMGVYESGRYPFLKEEMAFIEDALRARRPVLGVCLGSQLLAAVLGSRIRKGPQKEIGWHPVTLEDSCKTDRLWSGIQSPFTAFHWHGDIFDLPQGAVSLASSALTKFQAIRYGQNAYGVLLHMEVTPAIIGNMVDNFTDELREAKVDGAEILRRTTDCLPPLQAIGRLVFQRWASLVEL